MQFRKVGAKNCDFVFQHFCKVLNGLVAVAYGDDSVYIVGCSILTFGKLCKSVQ